MPNLLVWRALYSLFIFPCYLIEFCKTPFYPFLSSASNLALHWQGFWMYFSFISISITLLWLNSHFIPFLSFAASYDLFDNFLLVLFFQVFKSILNFLFLLNCVSWPLSHLPPFLTLLWLNIVKLSSVHFYLLLLAWICSILFSSFTTSKCPRASLIFFCFLIGTPYGVSQCSSRSFPFQSHYYEFSKLRVIHFYLLLQV